MDHSARRFQVLAYDLLCVDILNSEGGFGNYASTTNRQKIQITYTVFDHMYLLHKITGLTIHLQRQQTYPFLSRFIPSRKHKVFEFFNNFPCSFCHSLIIWH